MIGVGASLTTGLIMFTVNRVASTRDRKRTADETKMAELEKTIADLKTRVALYDKVIEPLWTAAQRKLIEELTHFHTPELDELIAKDVADALPDRDRPLMFKLMEERAATLDGSITPQEREAAAIYPIISNKAREERLAIKVATEPPVPMLVAVPPKPGEETP